MKWSIRWSAHLSVETTLWHATRLGWSLVTLTRNTMQFSKGKHFLVIDQSQGFATYKLYGSKSIFPTVFVP